MKKILLPALLCLMILPCKAQTKAIDLGLSVKWADTNIGAASPTDYGDYYSWGETASKTQYSWKTYKYCKGSYTTMTKYCANARFGDVDNVAVLNAADDVATAKLGEKWRTPTDAEWSELRNKCEWVWSRKNGVNGYFVIGPNMNAIFLPASGYHYDARTGNVGHIGYYWSSSVDTHSSGYAWYVFFNSDDTYRYCNSRYYGLSVRAVTD